MAWWESKAAAAVAGSVVSGLFNKRSADKQQRFQDAQSRTQYQRAVTDMKRAGLNPMLATKLGGNAAMSGASATMPDLGATVNSAENLRQMEPIRKAEARLKEIEVRIKKLKDVPAATVGGIKDRIVAEVVKGIDDYIQATSVVQIFDPDMMNIVESTLNSLKRSSVQLLVETLRGVDKGSLQVLEGLDWFKNLIKDL
jgi:hypothetical protein